MLDRLIPKKVVFLANRTSITILLAASTVIAGTIVSLSAYRILQQNQREMVNSAPVEPSIHAVTALGYLAPEDELIHLAAPTANQRLSELRVREGDFVKAGQMIAVMDKFNEYQASVDNAKARLKVMQARLQRVQSGEKAGVIEAQRRKTATLEAQLVGDVAMQKAVIDRQKLELSHAQREYQRYKVLADAGATSEAEVSNRRSQVNTISANLREAEARLSEIVTMGREQIAEARASLASITTVHPTDALVAQAELDEALSQLRQAKVALDSIYVRSPIAGQILRLNARPGEVVGSRGIADIGKTQQMYVIAEVYASDRHYVKMGQPVTIVSDYGGFTGELTGIVESIDLQIAKPAVVTNDPADDTDVRVARVKIRISSKDSERVRTLNNLEVRASIQIHRSPTLTLKR